VLLLGRHLAPAEDREAFGGGDLLDARLDGGAVLVERQERHARGVLADRGQVEVHDGAQEGVGHLRQDAGAVTGTRVGADRAAVLEVAQRLERELDDVVAGLAAERGDHRQAAGVLLERRVVHALLGGKPDAGASGVVVFTTGLEAMATVLMVLLIGDDVGPAFSGGVAEEKSKHRAHRRGATST
jgi:hypothetical protein